MVSTRDKAIEILEEAHALTDVHYVDGSGRHFSKILDIDMLYLNQELTSKMFDLISIEFLEPDVDIVIGVSNNAGFLVSHLVAKYISKATRSAVINTWAPSSKRIIKSEKISFEEKNVLIVRDILKPGIYLSM